MAFPQRTRTSQLFSSAATSYAVTLPAVNSGDLILLWVGVRVGAPEVPAGFTQLGTDGETGFAIGALFAKVSDGTETTATVTNASSSTAAAIIYKVSQWGGTLGTDVVAGSVGGSGSGTSAEPGISLTAAWGAADNLVLSFITTGDDGEDYTGFPAGYSDTFQTKTGTTQNVSQSVACAELETTSASETVGDYTFSGSESFGHVAVIIEPGSSGGAPVPSFTLDDTEFNPGETITVTTSNWGATDPTQAVITDSEGNILTRSLTKTATDTYTFTLPSLPAAGNSATGILFGDNYNVEVS